MDWAVHFTLLLTFPPSTMLQGFLLCTSVQLFLFDELFAWISKELFASQFSWGIICITVFLLAFHGLTVSESVCKVFFKDRALWDVWVFLPCDLSFGLVNITLICGYQRINEKNYDHSESLLLGTTIMSFIFKSHSSTKNRVQPRFMMQETGPAFQDTDMKKVTFQRTSIKKAIWMNKGEQGILHNLNLIENLTTLWKINIIRWHIPLCLGHTWKNVKLHVASWKIALVEFINVYNFIEKKGYHEISVKVYL